MTCDCPKCRQADWEERALEQVVDAVELRVRAEVAEAEVLRLREQVAQHEANGRLLERTQTQLMDAYREIRELQRAALERGLHDSD